MIPKLNESQKTAYYKYAAEKFNVTLIQARAVHENISWGFNWQQHEYVVIFTAKPEHKKQLEMFRSNVLKYAIVTPEVKEILTGDYAFLIEGEG